MGLGFLGSLFGSEEPAINTPLKKSQADIDYDNAIKDMALRDDRMDFANTMGKKTNWIRIE